MENSEIMTLVLKTMINMKSCHKLILLIFIGICITSTTLSREYISSTTALKREQMLIDASQSRCQQTVIREYVVSNQQPIIQNSGISSNDVIVKIRPHSVQVIRKNQAYNDCHNDEMANIMTIIEINRTPIRSFTLIIEHE